eukprot:CAMPEP_0184672892 /NCGR_PEP_ID=MMETSP0308-20130426/86367_1 /TAXON_ID=38269 /ORGANISM="Gloeochaete witrockiana, Strain SAG 46.84" /LENGTH=640 /DNA_ID=CAMNT_0027120303 /DNA_START=304 /DNA_END=2226 /DNA_ORIENTATION=+
MFSSKVGGIDKFDDDIYKGVPIFAKDLDRNKEDEANLALREMQDKKKGGEGQEVRNEMIDRAKETFKEEREIVKETGKRVAQDGSKAMHDTQESVRKGADATTERLKGAAHDIQSKTDEAKHSVVDTVSDLQHKAGEVGAKIDSSRERTISDAKKRGEKMVDNIVGGVQEKNGPARENVGEIKHSVGEGAAHLKEQVGEAVGRAKDVAQIVSEGLKETGERLKEVLGGGMEKDSQNRKEWVGRVEEVGETLKAAASGDVKVGETGKKLGEVMEKGLHKDIEGRQQQGQALKNVGNILAEGVREMREKRRDELRPEAEGLKSETGERLKEEIGEGMERDSQNRKEWVGRVKEVGEILKKGASGDVKVGETGKQLGEVMGKGLHKDIEGRQQQGQALKNVGNILSEGAKDMGEKVGEKVKEAVDNVKRGAQDGGEHLKVATVGILAVLISLTASQAAVSSVEIPSASVQTFGTATKIGHNTTPTFAFFGFGEKTDEMKEAAKANVEKTKSAVGDSMNQAKSAIEDKGNELKGATEENMAKTEYSLLQARRGKNVKLGEAKEKMKQIAPNMNMGSMSPPKKDKLTGDVKDKIEQTKDTMEQTKGDVVEQVKKTTDGMGNLAYQAKSAVMDKIDSMKQSSNDQQ